MAFVLHPEAGWPQGHLRALSLLRAHPGGGQQCSAAAPMAMGSSRSAARGQLCDSLLLGQQLANSLSGYKAIDCGVGSRNEDG